MNGEIEMGRAIISLTNKGGMMPFGQGLVDRGFSIYSTGGTAEKLRERGMRVTDISELTGFPEMMDGRLKTLHPKVFGGILGRQDLESHRAAQEKHGIFPFHIVAVNLYDFAGAAANPDLSFDETVEQVDVGGPSMIRAALKNYRFSLPVVDPDDYDAVLDQIDEFGTGNFSMEFRLELQLKAARVLANDAAAVEAWLAQQAEIRATNG